MLLVGDATNPRDIVIKKKSSQTFRIYDCHRLYDALQYPLMFWKGQSGYQFNIPMINPVTGNILQGKKVSCMDFYSYHLMIRSEQSNYLLWYKNLLHQFFSSPK